MERDAVLETGSTVRPEVGALSERVRSLRLPTSSGARSARPSKLPWALAAILAIVSAYLFQDNRQLASRASTGAASDTASVPAPPESPPNSTLSAPAPSAPQGNIVLESKGYIIPAHQVLVSPKVSGMIKVLNIEEGRRVKKGAVLAELESTDYEADLGVAKANLAAARQRLLELENGFRPEEIEQAKAELAEMEAQRDQLKAEWQRNVRLRSGKFLAEKEYEQAESAYKAMDRRTERLRYALKLMVDGPRKERIEAARADVAKGESDLAKAEWRLGNCVIKAPVTGTILKKNAEEGNIVNPMSFNGSYSLCDMADLSDLEVDLSIQERDVSKVFKGQRCEIRSEAFPDRPYQGKVDRLMPIADRAKGAVPVRVKVAVPADEEGVYLKPEMGAVVSFLRPEEKP